MNNNYKSIITSTFQKEKQTTLIYAILLDLFGMSTYTIPVIGEAGDIVYAPIYAIAIFFIFGKRLGKTGAGTWGFIGMVEEGLPGTDIVPTALLVWYRTYVQSEAKTMMKIASEVREQKDTKLAIEQMFAEDETLSSRKAS